MLYWLAHACREARTEAKRKQVHVAASADVDQSTVNRFESGASWPRNADRVVAAYADDLDLEPVDLWRTALKMWEAHLKQAPSRDVADATKPKAKRAAGAAARRGAQRQRSRQSGDPEADEPPRKSAQGG